MSFQVQHYNSIKKTINIKIKYSLFHFKEFFFPIPDAAKFTASFCHFFAATSKEIFLFYSYKRIWTYPNRFGWSDVIVKVMYFYCSHIKLIFAVSKLLVFNGIVLLSFEYIQSDFSLNFVELCLNSQLNDLNGRKSRLHKTTVHKRRHYFSRKVSRSILIGK